MEEKSSTQRKIFFNVNLPTVRAECPERTILNLKFLNHQIIANLP